MNYYDKIKKKLIDNEIYAKVKDYSKEQHKVVTYFEIGRLLSEAGGRYGDKIIEKYSERLMAEVGHKYNRRTLFRMEQFYKIFSDQKVSPLVTQLTWTHYVILISLKDYEKINYYMDQCARLNLSKRQLEQRIKNQEYERLPESAKSKLKKKEPTLVNDFVKDPILIKTVETQDEISEKILQRLILENIPAFLKELGEWLLVYR